MLLGFLSFLFKLVVSPIVDAVVEGLSFGAFSAVVNDGKLLWLED